MTNNHNNRNPLDFIRTLRDIRLPSDAKERMRVELSAYTDLHTLSEPISIPRPAFTWSMFMSQTRGLYAGALALVLIITGGAQASFASQDAVPGDILYPVKVALSEPIALALTASSEQKAELSARFASRRVDEAAELFARGALDSKKAEELAERFEAHVDTLTKEAVELEGEGNTAASLAVRTDLEQKVATRMKVLGTPHERELGDVARALSEERTEPEEVFKARIASKSLALAVTRENLDSVLALNTEDTVSKKEEVNLALLRSDESARSSDEQSAMLFFATQPADEIVSVMEISSTTASSTASTTPTTTPDELLEQDAKEKPQTLPASRFFSPFLNNR